MPLSFTDAIYGGLVPLAVTWAAFVVLERLLPKDIASRYLASLSAGLGFFAGYAALGLAPWQPDAHWHWLPYALLVAAIVGPIGSANGVRLWERAILFVVIAGITAWALIPTWDDLQPGWGAYAVFFVLYIGVSALSLDLLAERTPGPLLPAILWLTLMTASIIVALSGSLRFAQIGGVFASVFFGLLLIGAMRRETNILQGVGLVASIMTVGLLLIGQVNSFSNIPLAAYAIVPLAPVLPLIAHVVAPVKNMSRERYGALVLLLPSLLCLATALVLAVIAELASDTGY